MKRILAPHKEQDGYRYVRVPSSFTGGKSLSADWASRLFDVKFRVTDHGAVVEMDYRDALPQSRVISSSKVEEAVETLEYLRLCAEENLSPTMWPGRCNETRWVVVAQGGSTLGLMTWPTLREAYFRYRNRKAASDAKAAE